MMRRYDYKKIAERYDEEVTKYDSYAQDVIFGMCYEFVKPGEKLLDIGIGTGLSSIKFYKAGLKIYGIDSSEEMLNACQSKSFTEELKLYNISGIGLPYNDKYFDHVICCGVFHFLKDLKTIFREIERLIKAGGTFAFTIVPQETGEDFTEEITAWNTPIFKHSTIYIKKLLKTNKMKLLKEQRLLSKGFDKVNYDMQFSVLISKKTRDK